MKSGEKWKNLLGKQFDRLLSRHQLFPFLQEGRGDEIEAVIHLGACSDTIESNVDYLMENNVHFSIRLAEWALARNKRFIYASSAATYGDGARGFQDDESQLAELRPLNPYGFSKHLVDLWMAKEGAFKHAVALKYFNIFGPNEYHKGRMASMVLKMEQKARVEGEIQLYRSNDPRFPDGEQCRDFLYVKDAVAMTCAFLKRPEAGGVFNIGYGTVTTWNRLAAALFDALQKEAKIRYVEMPAPLLKQYQNYTCAEMGKFSRLFPSWAKTPIPEAVRDYVQNYLADEGRW